MKTFIGILLVGLLCFSGCSSSNDDTNDTTRTVGQAVPVAPLGTVVTDAIYPTFEWLSVPDVTHYLLWCEDVSNPEVAVIEQRYTPLEAGCESEDTLCSVTPETDLMGEYKWKVLSCAGDQCGRWSNYLSFSDGLMMSQKHFTNNGDGTVTDNRTGIMWSQEPTPELECIDPHPISRDQCPQPEDVLYIYHADAVFNCKQSDLAGYNDWRLPSVGEFASIMTGSGERKPDPADCNPHHGTYGLPQCPTITKEIDATLSCCKKYYLDHDYSVRHTVLWTSNTVECNTNEHGDSECGAGAECAYVFEVCNLSCPFGKRA